MTAELEDQYMYHSKAHVNAILHDATGSLAVDAGEATF